LGALAVAGAAPDRKDGGAEIPATLSEQPAPVAGFSAADRQRRLAEKGMVVGSQVLIRIFKVESELELWLEKDGRFEHFATYPICYWSGALGPKLREGDRQAPEGLYSIGLDQLHLKGRHPRSLDLGFPNALDRTLARTGSYILVHGGCRSIGCYAMTDPVMDEIFALSERALRQGQPRIQIHAFPFRMSEENMAAQAESTWHPFWLSLKTAYDEFEATRLAPKIGICGGRYVVGSGIPATEEGPAADAAWPARADVCEPDTAEIARLQSREAQHAATFAGRRRHVAVRWRRIRRYAGHRSARAAYAAARRARIAAYGRRRAQ
jgi:murein L,D-transpeptidase YafK